MVAAHGVSCGWIAEGQQSRLFPRKLIELAPVLGGLQKGVDSSHASDHRLAQASLKYHIALLTVNVNGNL